MRSLQYTLFALAVLCALSCSRPAQQEKNQPVYTDVAFAQEFSVKYNLRDSAISSRKVQADRNGIVQVLSADGLLKPYAGEFLYPGELVPERLFRPLSDKNINGMTLYRDHFVYADDNAVLSNAWAGNLYARHTLPHASMLEGGNDFDFLVSDGLNLEYVKDSVVQWRGTLAARLLDIRYDAQRNIFWLITNGSVEVFSPGEESMTEVLRGNSFTALALVKNNGEVIVGTTDGYLVIDAGTSEVTHDLRKDLPWTEITAVEEVDGKIWFGTTKGAFSIRDGGGFDYYASRRWLPSDHVVDIAAGPGNSVLILCDRGLARIEQKEMTLHDKAMYFEQQVRARHIRHGFNATLGYMTDGNLSTGSLEDSDNDGLWTSMYMGAEVFRYAVTKSDDALQNIRESMEAMERLFTINKVQGFPSRSFERRGYKYEDKPWRRADHPEWDWKSTTSSDEAIGHMFVYAAMAELLDDTDLKNRAIVLIDSLMQHVIKNDLYLIDWNGEPTQWGKWNPEYVNARPLMVGDRKLNASNITAMLQTAYHFTKKEVYRDKAFELLTRHGYYENLMRPMAEIGRAPDDADQLSRRLSEAWNHSDDEMYFLGYWGLYRYAFNDTLKANFKNAIIDHWQIERPEKEGAWNIFTALTGVSEFDLDEAIWYLKEYPLDLIHWKVENSHRKDIEMLEPNFRQQATAEVLPPDELPINRHNANRFRLDGGDNGTSEYSAGDIWLLPYWMGRYLGVISPPETPTR